MARRLCAAAFQSTLCRSVGIGTSRVEKYSETQPKTIGVDAFTDRAGWVTAPHGQRLDQQMRERGQQYVGSARERTVDLALFRPGLMPTGECVEALRGCRNRLSD